MVDTTVDHKRRQTLVSVRRRRLDSLAAFPLCSAMRLSSYPYVVVRIGCRRCARQGQYRLARLADRYGSEMTLPHLLELLSADCKLRERSKVAIYERCEAYFVDLNSRRSPDLPYSMPGSK